MSNEHTFRNLTEREHLALVRAVVAHEEAINEELSKCGIQLRDVVVPEMVAVS